MQENLHFEYQTASYFRQNIDCMTSYNRYDIIHAPDTIFWEMPKQEYEVPFVVIMVSFISHCNTFVAKRCQISHTPQNNLHHPAGCNFFIVEGHITWKASFILWQYRTHKIQSKMT